MPTLQQQALALTRRWLTSTGRKPFEFQEQAWREYLAGNHGLIYAPTGTGKTLAAFCGAMIQWLAENPDYFRLLKKRETALHNSADTHTQPEQAANGSQRQQSGSLRQLPPAVRRTSVEKLNRSPVTRRKIPKLNPDSQLQVLWVTPLRALATDTTHSLANAIDGLGLPWKIEKRTGDSDPALRRRQREQCPEVLVTTPESLTLMLSWPGGLQRFSALRCIVVDEWHELLGTKRGVQTELALARLRQLQPDAKVWGLSATIGNLKQAADVLIGDSEAETQLKLIQGQEAKPLEIRSLIPEDMERFPWAGHLGTRLVSQVTQCIEDNRSSLVFTNTRSQAESWYRSILSHRPELAGQIAVHHGSLDRQLRDWVEESLREGKLKCCVCTSSLDLGVDFPVVDHVIQIGSPKGNARLLQRAGRSGHQPGQTSRITFVPTNAMELIELAGVRSSLKDGKIESRPPLEKPLDVLAQHVVTVALGTGFQADALLTEVRNTYAYRNLSRQEWKWVLDFTTHGGASLQAYPDFKRVVKSEEGYSVQDEKIARKHRLSIGTIVGNSTIKVKFLKGATLGMVEDSFIGRMEPGDRFTLAGKVLELSRVHDGVAYVRLAKGRSTTIPRWMGGRMPLSTELSQSVRDQLELAQAGVLNSMEMKSVQPLLKIQQQWSAIPSANELLIEQLKTRDGFHTFVYPFDGRLVHEGMAAVVAWRMSRLQPISFSLAMNDHGFVLQSPTEPPLGQALQEGLFRHQNLAEDILQCLNESEMSKKQFREIARVAGLIFEGYPGRPTSARHLRASSNLFFDVFKEYEPDNLLLHQAKVEVLERQLEHQRLSNTMRRIQNSSIVLRSLQRPTPFCFPLLVDGLRDRISSEKLSQRIQRMQASLEKAAANV